MKIGLAQINPIIGDFAYNCEKICSYIKLAREQEFDLVVFPEMSLVGYPAQDLLGMPSFIMASRHYWDIIRKESKSIGVLWGTIVPNETPEGKVLHNSALFCHEGNITAFVHKRILSSYDFFNEMRYFEPGSETGFIDFKGKRLGIAIGEDIGTIDTSLLANYFHYNPIQELADACVDILLNIAAFPFCTRGSSQLSDLLRTHAINNKMHVAYVNQVGGNDELIFPGQSMVWDKKGKLILKATDFKEDLICWDTDKEYRTDVNSCLGSEEEVVEALTLGLMDYTKKCGFQKVLLGLSGGIDSAVAACIACKGLGPENVRAVAMPGPYSTQESLDCSQDLTQRLGIYLNIISIDSLFELINQELSPLFKGKPFDVTEENIQARLRGLLLMSMSNKFNELLINTGNKSELSVGYCTLYGDMTGGLSVLGDVPKTLVYKIARYFNEKYGWIPENIITRPPSAELSPGQKDADSLPSYHMLDSILFAYLEEHCGVQQIVEKGFDSRTVEEVVKRVNNSEYKRRQAPPVLRVTTKSSDIGYRFPIAHGYINESN